LPQSDLLRISGPVTLLVSEMMGVEGVGSSPSSVPGFGLSGAAPFALCGVGSLALFLSSSTNRTRFAPPARQPSRSEAVTLPLPKVRVAPDADATPCVQLLLR
jgi:hypothetical protein